VSKDKSSAPPVSAPSPRFLANSSNVSFDFFASVSSWSSFNHDT
jgi:hypothetical protein